MFDIHLILKDLAIIVVCIIIKAQLYTKKGIVFKAIVVGADILMLRYIPYLLMNLIPLTNSAANVAFRSIFLEIVLPLLSDALSIFDLVLFYRKWRYPSDNRPYTAITWIFTHVFHIQQTV